MKYIHAILTTVFIIISINTFSQTYTWNGGDGDFTVAANWTPAGVPLGSTANIVFDNVGDIIITGLNETITTLGDITIKNSSNIYAVTNTTISGLSILCNNLLIDGTSSLNIDQTDKFIQISVNSANIDGSIYLDNNDHKIIPISSTNNIIFNYGSSFFAGSGLLGYPFGDAGFDNVKFKNGADFYHFGGNSPFGSSSTSNVANFSPESNYFIINDGANVLFSNKTYGNIIIGETGEAYINVNVNTMGTGTDAFTFTSITTENGSLKYTGSSMDEINILGELNSTSGTIELQGGIIKFIGDCYVSSNITNPHEIRLVSYETNNFTLLNTGSLLTLESNLTIESSINLIVDGAIDFKTNKLFLIGSGSIIQFSNSAEIITANPNGIDDSFNNHNFNHSPQTTFELNGIETQNLGFSTSLPVGKLIINNGQGVKMDDDIKIDSLFLENGNFMIEDNTLTIKNDISRGYGKLFGGNNSNLEIINLVGDVIDFDIDENLTLNSFLLSCPLSNIHLQPGQSTSINDVTINDGSFNLGTNTLKVNNLLFLNNTTATLNIEEGSLQIDGDYDKNNGKIIGGNLSKLQFLSHASSTNIGVSELAELHVETNQTITLEDDLSIYNLLSLRDGELQIGDNELFIHGNVINETGILQTNNLSKISILGNGDNISLPLNGNEISTLYFDNTSSNFINIQNNITVVDELNLISGKVLLQNSNIIFADNAISTNQSDNSYIITGNDNSVSKVLAAGESFEFPIGTVSSFAPSTISPTNIDEFHLKVFDDVFEDGLTGNLIDNQQKVNLTWYIDKSDNSNYYDLSLNWNGSVNGTLFNQDDAFLSHFNINTNEWEKMYETTDVSFPGKIDVSQLSNDGAFFVSSIVNNAPIAQNQTFEIREHSPAETIVGELIATDPDANQNLKFFVQENTINPDAFLFQEDGEILVKDPSLEYSLHPTFHYTVDVCDDGLPEIACTQFDVTINLKEVTQDNLLITNYISPNGDGKNDTWIIRGLEPGTYSVAVIDGKGNVVFRSNDYKNKWDGTRSGNKLAPGVYYYSISSENFNKKGTITLVR